MKRIIAAFIVMLVGIAGVLAFAGTAQASTPGDSASNPIVVSDPSEVPEGAVTDGPVKNKETCETTQTWVLTVPGKQEVTHEETRWSKYVPGNEETFHNEYSYLERTRTKTENNDTQYRFPKQVREVVHNSHKEFKYKKENFKTQYHFRKYTETKSQTRTKDKHGNWGPWSAWSEYGPWIAWEPMTHESWQDSNAPLGSPADHADWTDTSANGKTQTHYHRLWQARADGQTRQVSLGFEYSGWTTEVRGAPWIKVDERTVNDPDTYTDWADAGYTDWSNDNTKPTDTNLVRYGDVETREVPNGTYTYGEWSEWTVVESGLLVEPTLPDNTDVHEYKLGPVEKVSNNDATEGYTVYYVDGGNPTLDLTDANWTRFSKDNGPEGWTYVDSRTVTDQEATPDVVTYYAWSDGKKCVTHTPTPTPSTPTPTPSEPLLPHTGAGNTTLWGLTGLMLLITGVAMATLGRKRGSH